MSGGGSRSAVVKESKEVRTTTTYSVSTDGDPIDTRQPSAAEKTDRDAEGARDRKSSYKSPSKPLLDVPEPKPLKIRGELRPLPDIKSRGSNNDGSSALAPISSSALARQQDDLAEIRKQATEAFQRNQELLAAQKQQQDELRKKVNMPPDDAERRAKYMREQRDRLLAIKKAEREAKVRAEEERRAKAGLSIPEGVLDQQFTLTEKQDSKSAEDQSADRRRAAMRNALARRMKQELIEGEKDLTREEQLAELDRQLRQVELMRKESLQREKMLAEQLKRQHALLDKRVRRSEEDDDDDY